MPNASPLVSQNLQAGPFPGALPGPFTLASSLPADAESAHNRPGLKAGVHGGNDGVVTSDEGQAGDLVDGGISLRLPPNLARMPVELSVAVPIRDFRVQNLLSLTCGEVIESNWGNGDDLPLISGQVQLAWTEFEVMDATLAVRVTRLA